MLALTEPTSRAIYTFALLALYAAPAALALAILARDCARRAGLARDAPSVIVLARGVAAVFVAYPAAIAVAARGMPDVGGLVLVVCALKLAERLARLLALRTRRRARVESMIRRVAVALALTLYAMFVFRRWYAFAAAGIVVVLALEVGSIALARGARFRWKDAVVAAALGALTLLALLSPVLVDWAPNFGVHDYADTYAGYRKGPEVFLRELGDWVGLIPALAALAGAAFLWARSRDTRLLRLTLGAAAVAARAVPAHPDPLHPSSRSHRAGDRRADRRVADAALRARPARRRFSAIAALGAITLSPLAVALNPLGLAPIAGLPRAPRADLDELKRLKDWVDQRARPDAKVCGLGSSYTFSGQLIGELWQLRPERGLSGPKLGAAMPDVDTVDGPPGAGLKDCAVIIVGDPVQTHLDPDYQQTVIVPSREMLTGQGIGAKFRRTGEVFHLEKGVSALVFERLAPLDDADIAALQGRWRAARARVRVRGARAVSPRPLLQRPLLRRTPRRRDRVLGDHQFLVGRDHEDDRRRILGADDLRVGAVRLGVEMDAHPFHVLERRFAHFPRVFADAGGEHDRLGAARLSLKGRRVRVGCGRRNRRSRRAPRAHRTPRARACPATCPTCP